MTYLNRNDSELIVQKVVLEADLIWKHIDEFKKELKKKMFYLYYSFFLNKSFLFRPLKNETE